MTTFSFDFVLDGNRDVPLHVKEFNGYFKGTVRIVKCDTRPTWVGQLRTLVIFNMMSVSTAFIYRTRKARVKHQGIEIDASENVLVIGMRTTLTQTDLCHMYEEIWGAKRSDSPPPEAGGNQGGKDSPPLRGGESNAPWRAALDTLHNFAPDILVSHTEFYTLLEQHSDVLRLQYIQPLCLAFVKEKGTMSEEQRGKIRDAKTVQLREWLEMLKTTPWELAFRETCDPLDPLIRREYERACVEYKVSVPRHVQLSMQVYYQCMGEMQRDNNTCFQWTREARKCLNLLEYETMEPLVMEFLESRAITWLDVAKTTFALKREYSEAKMVCQALMRTALNASRTEPELRGAIVPVYPPVLTRDQRVIADHIGQHYLTLVEGLPGTGKTKLIEWAFCRFAKVLLCTLTGMMTKSLRTRIGNRPEAAYTIDYLVSVAVHTPVGKAWLRSFDVLIIDEFSNTSTKSLAWLLTFLPNLTRIILVGDHEQIGSISPGDAMGDIKGAYQAHGHAFRLTENLRVANSPELSDLYMAPQLMSERNHRSLRFTERGPLTLVSPDVPMHGLLEHIFAQKRSLMCQQIIVLQNDIRHTLNEACQNICLAKGIIKQNKKHYVIGKKHYYVGSKIMFLENYNQTIKHSLNKDTILVSEPVCNGETGVITRICLYGHIYYITFVDNDDPAAKRKDVVTKKVLVSAQVGIKPFHMDLGYATTTTKVQGREFEYAVFWNNKNPAPCWTRAHAYVGLSRGKKHVWCVSTASDLYGICDRPNKTRETILSKLLQVCGERLFGSCAASLPVDVRATHEWVILQANKTCVPIKDDFVTDPKKKKKKRQEEEEEEEDLL